MQAQQASTEGMTGAFERGQAAFRMKLSRADCPYVPHSQSAKWWLMGFDTAALKAME